jgi:hypothetical protein
MYWLEGLLSTMEYVGCECLPKNLQNVHVILTNCQITFAGSYNFRYKLGPRTWPILLQDLAIQIRINMSTMINRLTWYVTKVYHTCTSTMLSFLT